MVSMQDDRHKLAAVFAASLMIGFLVLGPATKYALTDPEAAQPQALAKFASGAFRGALPSMPVHESPPSSALVPSGISLVDSLDAAIAASPAEPYGVADTSFSTSMNVADYVVQASAQSPEVRQVLEKMNLWFKKNPQGIIAMPFVPAEAGSRAGDASMMARAKNFVPDMQRRTIMNLILLGAVSVPVGWMAGMYLLFFIPPKAGGGGAGLVAKDALGNEITFKGWLDTHQANERKLVQGLKGDATYLIVTADKKIEDYALNAVCTHLGCVVPWNRAQNKFMCPCHGSQYDNTGKVVRGPAPLSLALAHVNDAGGKISLTPWTETDFRTNLAPWWK